MNFSAHSCIYDRSSISSERKNTSIGFVIDDVYCSSAIYFLLLCYTSFNVTFYVMNACKQYKFPCGKIKWNWIELNYTHCYFFWSFVVLSCWEWGGVCKKKKSLTTRLLHIREIQYYCFSTVFITISIFHPFDTQLMSFNLPNGFLVLLLRGFPEFFPFQFSIHTYSNICFIHIQ